MLAIMPKKSQTWGAQFKELREAKGYTQASAAKALQVPLRTLQKWEQGVTKPVDYIKNIIDKALQDLPAIRKD